jgi:hypothetical protein
MTLRFGETAIDRNTCLQVMPNLLCDIVASVLVSYLAVSFGQPNPRMRTTIFWRHSGDVRVKISMLRFRLRYAPASNFRTRWCALKRAGCNKRCGSPCARNRTPSSFAAFPMPKLTPVKVNTERGREIVAILIPASSQLNTRAASPICLQSLLYESPRSTTLRRKNVLLVNVPR